MAEGERPAPRLTPQFSVDNPEFQAALAAEVQARVDALLPDLMAKLAKASGAVPAGDDKNFVSALALQLAELTGQGSGRIYVAPEIVEARRQAFERLKALLVQLRVEKQMPAYRLTNKVQLNLGPTLGEVLIDPLYRDNTRIVQSTEIDWPGIPNNAMFPINEAAERVFAEFSAWTGTAPKAEADEYLAVTSHGAVVRGEAAGVLLRNDRPRGGLGELGGAAADPDAPAAGIRRKDPAPKRLVQVLGTLTKPVEVS